MFENHKYLAEIVLGQESRVVETEKFSEIKWVPIRDYNQYSLAPNAPEFCARWLRGKYSSKQYQGEIKQILLAPLPHRE